MIPSPGQDRNTGRTVQALRSPAGLWEQLAWALWVLLVLAAVGRSALYYVPRQQGAYPVFADGGRHWLRGEDLYDSQDPNSLCVFRYSPLTAVALIPLALAPDPVGSALLRTANLAAFLLGFGWWTRTALGPPFSREHRAVAWLLCAGMACITLMDVQLNLLTIGFILITLAGVAESRWNTAALAASLACCLKVYPAGLALVLAAVYPRRFAARWLAAMALCLLLPFVFQQPSYVLRQYADWVRWGLNQRYRPELDAGFQDGMMVCRRWLAPMSRTTYVWLEAAAGAAVALVCLWRRWRAPQSDLLACITGLCCGWMMAFGPATESQTYVQLAPVAAVFTVQAWAKPRPSWFQALVTACCVLLTLSQLQLLLPLDRPLHHLAAQPIAALLLMAAAATCGLRSLRSCGRTKAAWDPAGAGARSLPGKMRGRRGAIPSDGEPMICPARSGSRARPLPVRLPTLLSDVHDCQETEGQARQETPAVADDIQHNNSSSVSSHSSPVSRRL
ncbi:MAG TPA: glycosyltransferase family 87 protein [Gemmataceae bacterium]|nr:glycosyltransferase family 87 protein [Gemmataceae bacterium]